MKNLLTSLRASNETYNSMKHSARAIIRRAEIPLLAVIVLYKAATNLLFVPLMQQLWSLTLRFAPMHYLSNNNASDIFSSPAIILCITLIAILTAFWALYEFSVLLHGLDLARKGETIRLPALLRTSLADIRHAFLPQNWLVLVYSAVLIPFTNFFLAYNYITQLAVPEYIIGVIQANSRYYLLYLAAGAALLFLCVSWVLVLPLFVLERKSLWQSVKESFCCIRRRVFRAFLLLLRWNLSVVLRSLLLTAAVAVPLYGIIIAVGLQSTQAMFALSRAALAIEMPFFQFLIDCAITMAQCTILVMLHCRLRESLPSEPEPVQSGKHHRSTGRLLLGASVAGATLLTFALAFCYLALPRDDELLSMLGGVAPVVTAHRGYSAAAPENTLPAFQLAIDQGCEWAELFNNRHVKNRGISGDRSGWLLDRLDPIVGGHPKKLFLMIGVNDLAAGVSPDEIVANVARLIDRFQSESRWTKIYVQSILPVNGESFAKFRNHYEHGRQIVPLNKRLEALCDEKEVTYLDVWGALADHEGRLDKRYTNDGLHLTGEGYVVWRDAIKQHVK